MRSQAFAAAADGIRIAHQTEGEGAPLLLLSGQSNDHRWWDPVRGDFHTGHATITLDYRGTGASDKPDQPYSTVGFADDAIAVLDDLDLDRSTSTARPWAGASRSGWRRAIPGGCAASCSAARRPVGRTPSSAAPPCGARS